MRWIAVVAVVVGLLLWALPAHAQPAQDEAAGATQPPPVGGLFGLFGRSQPKHTPSPREEVEKETVVVATPTSVPPEPTETPTAAPKRSPKAPAPAATATAEPTVAPQPTVPPEPTASAIPTPTRKPKKGAKAEATATPTVTPTPEEEEEERPPEETPEAQPTEEEERGEAPLAPQAPAGAPVEPETAKPEKRGASRTSPSGGKSDVELPNVEIQGELEKPDIFFVLPRARDQSDEQLMRARIRREITRPVIKDWIEEEMLLK